MRKGGSLGVERVVKSVDGMVDVMAGMMVVSTAVRMAVYWAV